MPHQNRVTPEGDIIATSARGLMFGNRGGAFHHPDGTLRRRHWASRQWICCVLAFKGRRRTLLRPGRYTELFFLDEATALAAGHRPCFECQREAANRFATIWARLQGCDSRASAPAMDEVLHVERIDASGHKMTYRAELATLPPGAFVRHDGSPSLVQAGGLRAWTPGGYGPLRPIASTVTSDVLTPRTTVAVIAAGYAPALHPSAAVDQ